MKKLHNEILIAFIFPMLLLVCFGIFMSINVYLEFKGLIIETSDELFSFETQQRIMISTPILL
jgi:hypothetical protein